MYALLVSTKLGGKKLFGHFNSKKLVEKLLKDTGFEYDHQLNAWIFEHYMGKVLEITVPTQPFVKLLEKLLK